MRSLSKSLKEGMSPVLSILARVAESDGGFGGVGWMDIGGEGGPLTILQNIQAAAIVLVGGRGGRCGFGVWMGFGDRVVIDCGCRGC